MVFLGCFFLGSCFGGVVFWSFSRYLPQEQLRKERAALDEDVGEITAQREELQAWGHEERC